MKTNILKLFSSSSPQSNRMHHELDTVNLISHRLSQRNHNVPKTYAELAKAADSNESKSSEDSEDE